jgi:hypothetical protein
LDTRSVDFTMYEDRRDRCWGELNECWGLCEFSGPSGSSRFALIAQFRVDPLRLHELILLPDHIIASCSGKRLASASRQAPHK